MQDRNIKTCPLTLLENDLTEIQTYCGYSVVDSPVPKAVYRLTADLILLSNITQLTIKCQNNDTFQTINLKEIQTVHKVHCSCEYHADSFYIANSPLHCDETTDSNFTIEPKYIINLPYVHAFLGKSILDMIEEDDVFNISIPIKLLKLAIAEKLYQDRISLDQRKSFDLATVINQTQQDNKVFTGLGHLILNNLSYAHLQNSDFDMFNPFTWIQLIFGLIGTLALILAIFLYCRLKKINIVISEITLLGSFPVDN